MKDFENDGQQPPLFSAGNAVPYALVTALFFFWAIPNHLNDILIRQFMKSFELTRLEAGFIQSAFYLAYFVIPIPAALVMRRYGFKTGLIIGLFLYSAGTFLFCSAAMVERYGIFLVAQFVIASGAAFLETGANTFVVQLGDPRSSARRLNFSQAFNPLGAVTSVLIGTIFVFSGIELSRQQIIDLKVAGSYDAYLRSETLRVVGPYLVIGTIILFWAFLIIKTKFPKVIEEAAPPDVRLRGKATDLLHYPHFVFGVIAQFAYVGAQIGTWSFFIQYIQDYTRQPEKTAGYLLTGTLVLFTLGRFITTQLMKFFSARKLLGVYSVICMALIGTGVLCPGWVGVMALFMTSFFKSPMFPTIFALGVKGLGANTKLAGSIMVMAIVGGACAPLVMGLIFKFAHSMAIAMVVPLVCYTFIPYYAWRGSRVQLPHNAQLAPALH
jgi:FHS family L-fucose permease-like MFS transporter